MQLDLRGDIVEDGKELRVGFIGCGSHSFRNVYPTLQFVPVNLVATCDVRKEKADAYAKKFGADRSYSDYREMLEKEDLDAVFVVVGYDEKGRPLYPQIACDCMRAGCHVWIEKPPAASTKEIEMMMQVSKETGKIVLVGLKKMFACANERAKEIAYSEEFGGIAYMTLRYPQSIPTVEEFHAYYGGERNRSVFRFLDHLCHPMSLLLFMMGMPESFYYERTYCGNGVAVFHYANGSVATMSLTEGASNNGGMERTEIFSANKQHIIVDNNISLTYERTPYKLLYGRETTYFKGDVENASVTFTPEYSLGNLYNKAQFLLGYYNEIAEFVNAISENRQPVKGTLQDAWNVTRIFELFEQGPRKIIECK